MSVPGRWAVASRCIRILLAVGLLAIGCGDRNPRNDITDKSDGDTMAAVPGSPDAPPDTTLEAGIERITIGDRTFRLELAATPPYRNRGLMYRRSIDDDGGMLFVFTAPEVQNFWMGWCLTDIDIIYLDPRGRVTATHQMKVEPPQRPEETEEGYRLRMPHYTSRLPSQFVIELKGGTLNEIAVAIGDTIAIDVDRLTALAR